MRGATLRSEKKTSRDSPSTTLFARAAFVAPLRVSEARCRKNTRHGGFTILELIVTITIIAVLSAIVMTLFSNVKEKNRDARRMADLKQLENALNLYLTSKGQFPVEETAITITGSDNLSDALIAAEVINAVSADPISPNFSYTYETDAGGTTYTITFCLETDTIQRFAQGCENTLTP